MDYIQLNCSFQSDNQQILRELLMHELGNVGFESFVDTPGGLLAYIDSKFYSEELVQQISFPEELGLARITFSAELIQGKNWNEEWEKNFQPVLIASKCYIRAPFHEPKDVAYEIVIEPKMSFGTGHHETTSLMIEQMLNMSMEGKNVLDMGCGTGVLSVMATKLKATNVLAIDIDEWAYQNTLENCELNQAQNITVFQGDVDLIADKQFDIILANINRNILLKQIPEYAKTQVFGSQLLLSGIYLEDLPMIQKTAEKEGYEFLSVLRKNNWIAALFTKK